MQETFYSCPDSAPDPAGGAYSAPPDPIAGGDGLAALSPKIPSLLLAFGPRVSAHRASPLSQYMRLGRRQHDGLDAPV